MEFIGGPVEMTPPDGHATLMILISEARRLDLDALRRLTPRPLNYSVQRRQAKAKWAELRCEVQRLLDDGECAKTVRAILAGRYPFLGVIASDEIERCRRANEALIQNINRKFFSPPTTPPSLESSEGEGDGEEGGAGWVFCGNAGAIINCHNARNTSQLRRTSSAGTSSTASSPNNSSPDSHAATQSAALLFPSAPEVPPQNLWGDSGAATSPWGSSFADDTDDFGADVLGDVDDFLDGLGDAQHISFDFTSLASVDQRAMALPFHSPPATPNFSFDSLDSSSLERFDSNSSLNTSSFDQPAPAWEAKAAAQQHYLHAPAPFWASASPDPSSAESVGEASSLNTSLCGSPDDFFAIRSVLMAVDDATA